jgi:molybdopterin-guanine dinucleotide biosynthesis protein B
VRLVEEFVRRGLRVATIKHAHHAFQIDDAETDSARHRRAGASEVAIVSSTRWAVVHELRDEPEPGFDEVLVKLAPADLVLVEGYKSEPIPKIEVRRRGQATTGALAATDANVIAIAADHAIEETRLPVFALDDIGAIADFLGERFSLKSERVAK